MDKKDIYNLTAVELVCLYKQNKITCESVIKTYIDRINRLGLKDRLNCVACLNPNALEEAKLLDKITHKDLPLYGLPFLVKDNIDVKGIATTAGSIALVDNIAIEDAYIVKRLKELGAICLGKTNMTEFANFISRNIPLGYSSYGGQVINAYGKEFTPGGSSSGSAVAVSARLCAFSVGTDTSFSVVGCATENGVVGYRLKHNKSLIEGIIPISNELDTPGLFCYNIEDLKMIIEAIIDRKIEKKTITRLQINKHNIEYVSKEQMGRYHLIIDKLKQNGVIFDDSDYERTLLLKELMQRTFARDLNKYLANKDIKIQNLSQLIDFYQSVPQLTEKNGIEDFIDALNYSNDPLNDLKIENILKIRKEFKENIDNQFDSYQASIMTGPSNVTNFIGYQALSLPINISEKGQPRSMILFGKDIDNLISTAEEIERIAFKVVPPQLQS